MFYKPLLAAECVSLCVCVCVYCVLRGSGSSLMIDPRNVVTSLIGFNQLTVLTGYKSADALMSQGWPMCSLAIKACNYQQTLKEKLKIDSPHTVTK